jgi:hypothetical protein
METEKKWQRNQCGLSVVQIRKEFKDNLHHQHKENCDHFLKNIESWHWPCFFLRMKVMTAIIPSFGRLLPEKDLPWQVIFIHNQLM